MPGVVWSWAQVCQHVSCIVAMAFKCFKCPGVLLRRLGEKEKHKKIGYIYLREDQEAVRGARVCDGREIGGQNPEGYGQDA